MTPNKMSKESLLALKREDLVNMAEKAGIKVGSKDNKSTIVDSLQATKDTEPKSSAAEGYTNEY